MENKPSCPLDLSQRRDSVEISKAPSPYNSSNFGENAPSMRGSPSTPIHHYSSPTTTPQHSRSPANYPNTYSRQLKRERETPSLMDIYTQHSQQPCFLTENMTPNMLQVVDLYRRMTQQQQHKPSRELELSETSSFNPESSENVAYPMVVERDEKLSRRFRGPFKAYVRDPLSITTSFPASDTIIDSQSAEKYNIFRERMLKQIHAANGGSLTISNPKMRRTLSKAMDCGRKSNMEEFPSDSVYNNNSDSSNAGVKDSAYYERRKKNNAAAKVSRDRRRIKEDELTIRTAYLEKENFELKIKLASAEKQLAMFGVTANSTLEGIQIDGVVT